MNMRKGLRTCKNVTVRLCIVAVIVLVFSGTWYITFNSIISIFIRTPKTRVSVIVDLDALPLMNAVSALVEKDNGAKTLIGRAGLMHLEREYISYLHHEKPMPLYLRHDGQNEVKIPHIFHQYWHSHNIPETFHFQKWIKSWTKYNPRWSHWFWTANDVRKLIHKNFAEFLPLYDDHSSIIDRVEFMRYFVLYKYGGIYVDLDMENVRPLSNWSYTYHCFCSQNAYENSFFFNKGRNMRIRLANSIIACQAKHPFLKLIINNISHFYKRRNLSSYIPPLLDIMYEVYNQQTNHQRDIPESKRFIPVHPEYFMPTYDTAFGTHPGSLKHFCHNENVFKSIYQRWVCKMLRKKHFQNNQMGHSYGIHHWVHMIYAHTSTAHHSSTLHIQQLVSNIVIPNL